MIADAAAEHAGHVAEPRPDIHERRGIRRQARIVVDLDSLGIEVDAAAERVRDLGTAVAALDVQGSASE